MKPKPCEHCGAAYHAPYEDGLFECIQALEEQRDDARDERDNLARELDALRAAIVLCSGSCGHALRQGKEP